MERFLFALANRRRGLAESQTFRKRYAEFFPSRFPQETATAGEVRTDLDAHPGWEHFRAGSTKMIAGFASLQVDLETYAVALRRAWDEPDQRLRDWYIFGLRHDFHWNMAELGHRAAPPALTPFEQAMVHFQRISARAKHCANPDCPAPYFIAPKRSYKYCSEECAKPAQQAYKREWWAQHGPDWRRDRKKGAKKHAQRKRRTH